ncbi:MAG: NAD(P)H-dependent oxidoreductase [Methanoregula sp.]|jgi:multimeric flavodoxin WrbA
MKIMVLNGSPKGDISVTMQYVAWIKKKFPGDSYETLNVAHEITKLEKDPAAFEAVIENVQSADLIFWAFPLYFLLVPAQYKRFIELVFERKAQNAFAGKYAASLSTSIHYADMIAHDYIHAISDDLGMKYLGAYSAEMKDLLRAAERERLERFASLVFSGVEKKIPVQRMNAPVVPPALTYVPGKDRAAVQPGAKKVVILTDDNSSSKNLTAMIARLTGAFSGKVEVINLHDIDIRGPCLGCCTCAYDNTCVYTDGYVDFYKNKLATADILLFAGAIRDRYLSSTWKLFFDRSFFKGHTPGLEGKQIGFVIAGPLGQIPSLKEGLVMWADGGGCNTHFVTDEVADSGELDALLDTLAGQLVQGAEARYIPPHLFYAVGGHKIFRDNIYGGMRFVFQADYRYYTKHKMFDFPQADLKTRCMNAIMIPLTRITSIRKKVYGDMKHHMIELFAPVLKGD